jgi:hypothetical protein
VGCFRDAGGERWASEQGRADTFEPPIVTGGGKKHFTPASHEAKARVAMAVTE